MKKIFLIVFFIFSLLVAPSLAKAADPYGWLDGANCSSFSGWTCDPDNFNQAIDVHFYTDNNQWVGAINANQYRQDLVNANACGGTGNHGFTFTTPSWLKDGKNHNIYAYAINTPSGNNPQLSGSPKTINCGGPPTPSIALNSSCTSSDTSNLVTISWSATSPPISYVDISTSSNFSSFYNKYVGGATSTSASSGFNGYYGVSGPLTFQPNTTYYVRLWNGSTHSSTASFTTPGACANSNPIGYFDGVNCNSFGGWACDADNYNQAIDIHFYTDEGGGTSNKFIGAVTANQQREQAVGDRCGGNRNHGFTFTTPDWLKDGASHKIYAYAINIPSGNNPQLTNSPLTLSNCYLTLSGKVTTNTGAGIPGVVINQGYDTNPGPPACMIGKQTTNASGNFTFTGIPYGKGFCMRAPSINGYTGPDRSYECQIAGRYANPDGCGLTPSNDMAVDNMYNFIYTPLPTPTPTSVPTPTPTPTPTAAPLTTVCPYGLNPIRLDNDNGLLSFTNQAKQYNFSTFGTCIFGNRASIPQFAFPSYAELKSIYFDQLKE